MPSFNEDQIYIVTGASSGLGEATALMLNKKGATVVAPFLHIIKKRLDFLEIPCYNTSV